MDWALACELKGHWFDSGSGHMPGLQVGSLHLAQWGRARSNQLIFLSHITVSLPLFLPLFPSYLKPATSPAGIIFLDLLNLTPIMVARKKAVTEKQTNAWTGVSNTLSMLACGEKRVSFQLSNVTTIMHRYWVAIFYKWWSALWKHLN